MKIYSLLFLFLIYLNINAQATFTTQPQYPTETDQITITFDVTKQTDSRTLVGYTQDVYAYTCVTTSINNGSPTRWQYEKAKWSVNTPDLKLTRSSTYQNVYSLTINNPRNFYGITNSSEKITELDFVLRSYDSSKQTENIYVPLYSAGISIVLNSPTVSLNFGDPMRSPVFISSGATLPISVSITAAGTTTLYINGTPKVQTTNNSFNYNFVANDYSSSKNDIVIIAVDNANHKDSTKFVIFKNPAVKNLPLPAGNQIGINYGSDPTKVTLAFYAPKKSFVYVVGEFGSSDWKVDTTYFLNRYEAKTDSVIWWTTISNLESGKEFAYQFLVDGTLRIYDPYTEKILDKDNDPYIPTAVYPNLKTYPSGKTSGLVGILQTNQPAYSWKVPSFTRPLKEKLVIYELLIRDFVSTHYYKTLIDTLSYFKKLGINAIELMPISEFGGNDSWGYNSTTFFAPDKYYGTKNDLKAFIDACHQNGIAVIQDIVLNHAYNDNSMVQLYWDNANNRPAANNPWFNTVSPNTSYSYGNDFNHESKDTKYFVDRVTSFWLTEYKIDGFRFDFTKGFTNTPGEGTPYNASRIAILKRIAAKIWSVSPDAYVILEHFCENSEEMELANFGMMLWGNLNGNYNEATMGLLNNSNFNNVSYKQRGWSVPNLVGYMESHDEERLMYRNLANGRSTGSYDIKNLTTALSRIQLAAPLFILVPGPKMIWEFGELGYDISRDYNGKLTAKPIRWDYAFNNDRRKLFNVFANLIRLKNNYPLFSTSDFQLNAYSSVKSLYMNHSSMNAAVFGNFDVYSQDYQTLFQSTGKWYEFFSGDSLNVTDVDNTIITLQPGEYRLYTSKKIGKAAIYTDVKNENIIPIKFELGQNYPNPFNPSTVINWQIEAGSYVTLKVYDLLGREVATLVDEYKNAGAYNSQFSTLPTGRQVFNSKLATGIYFYRLQAGKFVSTKKMILIK